MLLSFTVTNAISRAWKQTYMMRISMGLDSTLYPSLISVLESIAKYRGHGRLYSSTKSNTSIRNLYLDRLDSTPFTSLDFRNIANFDDHGWLFEGVQPIAVWKSHRYLRLDSAHFAELTLSMISNVEDHDDFFDCTNSNVTDENCP